MRGKLDGDYVVYFYAGDPGRTFYCCHKLEQWVRYNKFIVVRFFKSAKTAREYARSRQAEFSRTPRLCEVFGGKRCPSRT